MLSVVREIMGILFTHVVWFTKEINCCPKFGLGRRPGDLGLVMSWYIGLYFVCNDGYVDVSPKFFHK